MARKPHNYVHFQNLVNELKEQNEHTFADLQTHLEVQTDVLQSMKGYMLQGIQRESADLKKQQEDALNDKKKKTDTSKLDLQGGENEGVSKLANTLSTSLLDVSTHLKSQTDVLKGMSNFFDTKLPKILLKETEIEEEQTSVLSNMLGFFRKKDKDDIKRNKEERLERADKDKFGLTSKSKLDLPRFSGKGFMGMLGNFLSTALIGIPGGLRRFLPRSLGMALIPKLARGVAFMVAGPALIEALQAGFSQKTFTGGISAFIDSYYSSGSKPYNSLGAAAMGSAGKGALLGFALGGPRGAIMAGILSGALGGLNHVFAEDKGKMNSASVMTKVKEHLLKNLSEYASVGLGIMGAKLLLPLGLGGMIAGAVLGSAIGFIGSGALREMMTLEEGGEKNLGVAFRTGLKNWYMKIDWGSGAGAAGAGAIFGAAIGGKFGPHGMLAGALFGAGIGLLGGPILSEALKIDTKEGKGMADAMKKATWNYIKKQAKNPYVTSALAGATAGGILGSVGTLPGMIAGAIIGAIFGVIAQWLTNTIGEFAGEQFAKAFGITKLKDKLSPAEEAYEKFKKKTGTGAQELASGVVKRKSEVHGGYMTGNMIDDPRSPHLIIEKLKAEYMKALKKNPGMMDAGGGVNVFQPWAAKHAAGQIDTPYRDSTEIDALKLQFLKWQSMGADTSVESQSDRLKKKDIELSEATSALSRGGFQQNQSPPVSFIQDSSSKMNITTTPNIEWNLLGTGDLMDVV